MSNADVNPGDNAPSFTMGLDLAQSRLGGAAIHTNDEFFAEKENLVKPERAVFIPDKYTDRGKWMDGWESRRKRVPGFDHCVIRLGLRGVIHGFDIDTSHFLGNHPPLASVDALDHVGRLKDGDDFVNLKWVELLAKSPLKPGAHNYFEIKSGNPCTHLRLNIYPDGGVARFRAYGEVEVDWRTLPKDAVLDFASVLNGGSVVGCNDMFFGPKENLIMPGRGINMGDGWETRRRRTPGNDWIVVKLAAKTNIARLEIDTAHFKGNYPDRASVEGCVVPDGATLNLDRPVEWREILPMTLLEADKIHNFAHLASHGPYTHVRLNVYPDGGISRLRVFGTRSQ